MAALMMFRASSSRRLMSTTASTLSGLSELLDADDAKQQLAGLRATYAEIAKMKTTYAGEPEPIDFASYKTKIDPNVVKEIEDVYTKMVFPAKAEVEPKKPEAVAEVEKNLSGIDDMIKETQARIVELKANIADLESKKTHAGSTVQDYLSLYPELEDEIDKEIHNHQWDKDVIGKSA